MKTKWYIEFPVVLLMIGLAVFAALNLNLPSCNSAVKQESKGPEPTPNYKPNPGTQKWTEGKSLFKSNCAACHNPKADGTGPALTGALGRWKAAGNYKGKTGEQWLHTWVKNWNDVVAAQYKYGVDMANSRVAQMNTFPFLKEEEIDKIFFYLDSADRYAPTSVPLTAMP